MPLREPQQGQPRLRVPPVGAGVPIAALRLLDLAEQPVQLALLVDGRTERELDYRGRESAAGQSRLGHGLHPRALELQELCAMHHAEPGVRHEVGLGLAPAPEGRRPVLATSYVDQVMARVDGGAVAVADHDR